MTKITKALVSDSGNYVKINTENGRQLIVTVAQLDRMAERPKITKDEYAALCKALANLASVRSN